MPPKYSKGDRVRLKATLFDDEKKKDREGRLFSKQSDEGNGEWCHGSVTHVYAKKGRQAQKYRVKYDGGQTMTSLEEQIEAGTLEEEDSEESSDGNEFFGSDYVASEGSGSTVGVARHAGVMSEQEEEQGNVTDDSEGENGEDRPLDERDAMEVMKLGDQVVVHGLTWERREDLTEDSRTEPELETTFANIRFDESTREVDVFLHLMPLSKETLLEIVRDGAKATGDKRPWEIEHIEAVLAVIIGGAQYKVGTNLWATKRKGMLKPPDFGLYLSKERFQRILRYWARGPDRTTEKLRENPWEEVDVWIRGFNKNRKREIVLGTDVTPDEMMFEWTENSGAGGIPHKSFIERKPKPHGSEFKSICEGTFGMCVKIEL
jgi:hypothetical protein